jgi:hypothetical protein
MSDPVPQWVEEYNDQDGETEGELFREGMLVPYPPIEDRQDGGIDHNQSHDQDGVRGARADQLIHIEQTVADNGHEKPDWNQGPKEDHQAEGD